MKIVLEEIENFRKSVQESVSLGTEMELIILQSHRRRSHDRTAFYRLFSRSRLVVLLSTTTASPVTIDLDQRKQEPVPERAGINGNVIHQHHEASFSDPGSWDGRLPFTRPDRPD